MNLRSLSLCVPIGALNLTGCSRISTPTGPAAPEVLITTVAARRPGDQRTCQNANGFINSNISARVSGNVISQTYEQFSSNAVIFRCISTAFAILFL
ncbi:MAG: hypothetical protein Udaeo2_29770 [Candidatus Udaeobacter sp.]|nr:MAG: hypothetical protein Udaeo2_29770 [Candidatus Udaeobacter sp.]